MRYQSSPDFISPPHGFRQLPPATVESTVTFVPDGIATLRVASAEAVVRRLAVQTAYLVVVTPRAVAGTVMNTAKANIADSIEAINRVGTVLRRERRATNGRTRPLVTGARVSPRSRKAAMAGSA